jgi:RNA polymerase sigma-70 factor (ECF subfamily)
MGVQTNSFDLALTDTLPRLRAYALSLTRNRDNADDLVQQTVLKALAGRSSHQPGSNFAGWIFRIQRNEFVAEFRRAARLVDVCDKIMHAMADPPRQEEAALARREFFAAFQKLHITTRVAFLLRLRGLTYKQISGRTGVSTGTVKSRVSRGRVTLGKLLDRPDHRAAAAYPVAHRPPNAQGPKVQIVPAGDTASPQSRDGYRASASATLRRKPKAIDLGVSAESAPLQ